MLIIFIINYYDNKKMKLLCCVLIILTLSLISCKKSSLKSELNSLNIEKFSSETKDSGDSFGLAKNGGFYLADNAVYISLY